VARFRTGCRRRDPKATGCRCTGRSNSGELVPPDTPYARTNDQPVAKVPRFFESDLRRAHYGRLATTCGGRTRPSYPTHTPFGRAAGCLLAGFDFPIEVPLFWARKAGIESFEALLAVLDEERWRRFFEAAEEPGDISLERPFFPARSRRGVRRASLAEALGAPDMTTLLRHCDRATRHRRAACCLFWTLGGQQVGKAALSGWRDVVLPQFEAGARLWPFHGSLGELSREDAPILAETYPAEAYRRSGITFGAGRSKRRQADRKVNTEAILRWADETGVELDGALVTAIEDGFGAGTRGEDPFDAMAGLAGMIEVVDGKRAAAPAVAERCAIEGWIVGQLD